jgi:hypothetical protein
MEPQPSWLEKLWQAQAEEATRDADNWQAPLERLRGEVSDDGIERIPSQSVFDFLGISQRARGAGAGRRLARVMHQLGWRPMRTRGLARSGYREKIRGYCRDTTTNKTVP